MKRRTPRNLFTPYKLSTAQKVMDQIKGVLSLNLLVPDQLEKLRPGCHYTTGHCYHATEALWYLWGKKYGFKPRRVVVDDNSHWFLQHPVTNDVVDPTAQQFPDGTFSVPYWKSHGVMFPSYPRKSNRCKELLRRIKSL